MRIGIVTDATCDLPDDFIRRHRIHILPVTIRLGHDRVFDERDPSITAKFYEQPLSSRRVDVETIPLTALQIRKRFLERLVLDYDYVICIVLSSSRSPLYKHATEAAFALLDEAPVARLRANVEGLFALRVIDSLNVFGGTGVLVAEACRLLEAGVSPGDICDRLQSLRESIGCYLVPRDLYYLRHRAIQKGERSARGLRNALAGLLGIRPVIRASEGETQAIGRVFGFDRAVQKLFAHAASQVRRGGHEGSVVVSYGGDARTVPSLPGYGVLMSACAERGMDLLPCTMSATAMVNVGPGCVSLAYSAEV